MVPSPTRRSQPWRRVAACDRAGHLEHARTRRSGPCTQPPKRLGGYGIRLPAAHRHPIQSPVWRDGACGSARRPVSYSTGSRPNSAAGMRHFERPCISSLPTRTARRQLTPSLPHGKQRKDRSAPRKSRRWLSAAGCSARSSHLDERSRRSCDRPQIAQVVDSSDAAAAAPTTTSAS